ncbi:MAG TPA: LptF/LptG family permease [Saprospiraceae bacterium]|nr:LptF/LptG family permease [Saprospiraceae bacterium]HNT21601.1 LptF/LptG family permease [Saprospiraceae bacterium]
MEILLGRLKKIDRLLITSFLPPMALSFMIALFVLTMQFFWLYIDEIMGKGIGLFQIIELISYLTVSFVPLALPMSVLLASVMVFGNLGERYELSSMKSAGISLIRIMRPLVVVTILVAGFSYLASNYIIPKANLKFFTRLNDIRRQKPTLALEEGIFNDDFYGYSIYIGKKKNENIEDVIIYDQSKASDLILCTRAEKGRMYTAENGRRFVLELENGEQVEEPTPRYLEGGRRNYPLMRTRFARYTKSFDLDEFAISATDESQYSQNQKMLSNRQLLIQIDTIKKTIGDGERKVGLGISKLFNVSIQKQDSISVGPAPDSLDHPDSLAAPDRPDTPDRQVQARPVRDSTSSQSISRTTLSSFKEQIAAMSVRMDSLQGNETGDTTLLKDSLTAQSGKPRKDDPEVDLKPGLKVAHFYELLDSSRRSRWFRETGTAANLVQSEIINVLFSVQNFKKKEILHWQQYYQKYTLALSCILFLFIGAPMGAIVRKGGFGYPLLIAIIFFIMYIMASKLFEKLTDSMVLRVEIGMWMTTLIISAIGIYLTYRASKDMSSNILDVLTEKVVRLFSRKKRLEVRG